MVVSKSVRPHGILASKDIYVTAPWYHNHASLRRSIRDCGMPRSSASIPTTQSIREDGQSTTRGTFVGDPVTGTCPFVRCKVVAAAKPQQSGNGNGSPKQFSESLHLPSMSHVANSRVRVISIEFLVITSQLLGETNC